MITMAQRDSQVMTQSKEFSPQKKSTKGVQKDTHDKPRAPNCTLDVPYRSAVT